MLKILQVRLQQYVNQELPDVQTGFRKGRGTRDQTANISWIMKKAREFQKNIYFCFINYAKAFDNKGPSSQGYCHLTYSIYAEYIIWNAELVEAHAGIKIARRNINNLRYADDTTLSYDADVFPPMYDFLHHLKLKAYQKRRVGIIENGSWAPCAGRVMKGMLETMKDIEIVEPMVTIRSAMKQGDIPALEALADAMLA